MTGELTGEQAARRLISASRPAARSASGRRAAHLRDIGALDLPLNRLESHDDDDDLVSFSAERPRSAAMFGRPTNQLARSAPRLWAASSRGRHGGRAGSCAIWAAGRGEIELWVRMRPACSLSQRPRLLFITIGITIAAPCGLCLFAAGRLACHTGVRAPTCEARHRAAPKIVCLARAMSGRPKRLARAAAPDGTLAPPAATPPALPPRHQTQSWGPPSGLSEGSVAGGFIRAIFQVGARSPVVTERARVPRARQNSACRWARFQRGGRKAGKLTRAAVWRRPCDLIKVPLPRPESGAARQRRRRCRLTFRAGTAGIIF